MNQKTQTFLVNRLKELQKVYMEEAHIKHPYKFEEHKEYLARMCKMDKKNLKELLYEFLLRQINQTTSLKLNQFYSPVYIKDLFSPLEYKNIEEAYNKIADDAQNLRMRKISEKRNKIEKFINDLSTEIMLSKITPNFEIIENTLKEIVNGVNGE